MSVQESYEELVAALAEAEKLNEQDKLEFELTEARLLERLQTIEHQLAYTRDLYRLRLELGDALLTIRQNDVNSYKADMLLKSKK